jgi:hypothetical protein
VQALALTGPVPAALAGGVLVHGRLVRQAFLTSISASEVRLEPIQNVSEPAQGALTLARRAWLASA